MAINPETRYTGKIKPSSTDYPYGEARNITLPGDGTGTPWEAALVNDLFGFQQALLSAASIVPSGNPDKVGASQYLQAVLNVAIPQYANYAALQAVDTAKIKKLWLYELHTGIPESEGLFYWDATVDKATADGGLTIDPSVTLANQGTGSGLGCWIRDYTGDVSVKWYGAVGDGATDDNVALQAALTAAQAADKFLYVPEGEFFFTDSNGLSGTTGQSMRIRGEGKDKSIFKFDNFANTPQVDYLINHDGNVGTGAICHLENVGFVGRWGDLDIVDFTESKGLVRLTGYDHFYALNIRVQGSRSGGLEGTNSKNVVVLNSHFENCYRDSCRFENPIQIRISNNYFKNIQDDSIAVPILDTYTGIPQSNIVITDNLIEDSQGIATIGGKFVTIANNNIIRPIHRGILVGQGGAFETGHTSGLAISVIGNNIVDGFDGTVFSASSGSGFTGIHIYSELDAAKDTVGTAVGGVVIAPWDYSYTLETDEGTNVNPGLYSIRVVGNSVTRTLPEATNYSDYGFGQRLSRSGYVNPAITVADMIEYGIEVQGQMTDMIVSDNTLKGMLECIRFYNTQVTAAETFYNCMIKGNTLSVFTKRGIGLQGEGFFTIDGNVIDGDPYHESAYRNADGSWTTDWSLHQGINFANTELLTTAKVTNNIFKNVGVQVYRLGADVAGLLLSLNNVFIGQPAVTGYSASNKGIGYVYGNSVLRELMIIKDSDPTSATFGETLEVPLNASPSIPTTGFYMVGDFVRDTSSSTTYGWKRLTVGSAHVLGVDWAAI